MTRHARAARLLAVAVTGAAALLIELPGAVAAHGIAPGPPDATTLVNGWSFDVAIWLPIALAGAAFWLAVRKVKREHPGNPVPRRRSVYWFIGLGALVLALQSPIERYDTTLFSDHMIQHLLLTMVAAPFLALGGPITLLLRVATPDARKRILIPALHSRVVRVISHPAIAWLLFTGYMFASHFSPLFDAALEDPGVHFVEHAFYLGTAMLFWWPVVGVDPSQWRLRWGAKMLYLGLGMPWSSFLGLAILSAQAVLYQHYATLVRPWGWTPLQDQQWAGGIMWAGGDGVFLIALVLALAGWLKAEEVEGRRQDMLADMDIAAAAKRGASRVAADRAAAEQAGV
jgi:cytochrome c oxidase assembly factor CtaG